MAVDIRPLSYYESLSPDELRDEITREEELLSGLQDQLSEATTRRDETRKAMDKDGLIRDLEELQRAHITYWYKCPLVSESSMYAY